MRPLLVSILVAACGSSAAPPVAPASPPARHLRQTKAQPADSPYDVKVWIAKLGDPRESERAVTEIEHLGDPSAIPALGDAWLRDGRPVRMLQVMISLARPLTPDEAKQTFMVDFESTGRPASWDKALPFLLRAVAEVDEANPRSVDSAYKAATALAEAKLGVDVLVEVAVRPVTKKLIAAQVAAIRALGSFAGDAKAAKGLVSIVAREPPPHPRTLANAKGRGGEEAYGMYLATVGASVNALGELHTPTAAGPLVIVMYRAPELFMQVRRALVASGGAAKVELAEALRGTNKQVNELFAAHKLDFYCGDLGDGPCVRVSAKDFYPAVVLGDFYDFSVVRDLLVALKRPPAPVYYSENQPSPNTQQNAIFDSLRKIGASATAEPLRAFWAPKSRAALQTRVLAIAAYPFIAKDLSNAKDLAVIAADNAADDQLRTEAATAVARLSLDLADVALFERLAAKYLDASAKKTKEGLRYQKDVAAADKVLDAAKRALDAAKTDLIKIAKDAASTVAQIKAATATAKTAEDDFKLATRTHKDKTAPAKAVELAAKAYVGYARMFQTHIARIEIAVRCKGDPMCLGASLKLTPDAVLGNVRQYIKDIDAWTDDDKRGLVSAAIDRAMLELGKLGAAAAGQTDALLAAVSSDDRVIRLAVLLTLPRIAKLPCPTCVTQLDRAIKAGEGKTTLGDLNYETTMLRNYFAWAGTAP